MRIRSGRATMTGTTLVALLVAGCSSSGSAAPAPSTPPTAARPADLGAAHVLYVGYDQRNAGSTGYVRLYSATVAGGDARPVLPDRVTSTTVLASRDGSVIVFDTLMPPSPGSGATRPVPVWWWSGPSGTHRLAGVPEQAHAAALAPDGASLVVVTGGVEDLSWSVQRVTLATDAATTVCTACLPVVGGTRSVADLAVDGDGSLLATMSSFQGGFYGIQHQATLRLLDPRTGAVRWSTTTLAGGLIDLADDGTFVWSGVAGRKGWMLHEVTGTKDRTTGVEAVFAGRFGSGWWIATRPSDDPTGALTFSEERALAPEAQRTVATWPSGVQVDSLVLSEVTQVDLPAGA